MSEERTICGDDQKAAAHLALASVTTLGASLALAAPPTAYVTSETAGVGVIDLDQMTLTKTFALGADGPRGLSLTADGTRLLRRLRRLRLST
jgi:hypothetical protein